MPLFVPLPISVEHHYSHATPVLVRPVSNGIFERGIELALRLSVSRSTWLNVPKNPSHAAAISR
jgi:hypothetical protein